jgi:hypothetical protein
METTTTPAPVTKVEVLEYSLQVKGIWGRNRSVKFTSEKLARVPVGEPKPLAEVLALANAKLVTMKVKPGSAYNVVEQPMTVEKRTLGGVPMEVVSFMVFSGKKLHSAHV